MKRRNLIKESFSYAWNNIFDSYFIWLKYVLVGLLLTLIVGLLNIVGGMFLTTVWHAGIPKGFMLLGFLSPFLIFFATYCYYCAFMAPVQNMFDFYDGKQLRGFSQFFMSPRIFFTQIFSATLALVGYAFLILPGMILMARWSLAHYIVLDCKCGVIEGMKRSWYLTSGYTGTFIFFDIAWMLLFCIPFAMLFITPFFILVRIYLYRELSKDKGLI